MRTRRSPRGGEAPAVEVLPGLEQLQHLIEAPGQGLGAAPHLPGQVGHLAGHPLGLAGGPQVGVAVGAVVDGMGERVRPVPRRRSRHRHRSAPAAPRRRGRLDGSRVCRPWLTSCWKPLSCGAKGTGRVRRPDDLGPLAEVGAAQVEDPPLRGDDPHPDRSPAPAGHGQHRHPAARLAPLQHHHVARAQPGQRLVHLAPGRGRDDGPVVADEGSVARRRHPARSAASARRSARARSRRASRVSRRTTAVSAWNWANDRLSR